MFATIFAGLLGPLSTIIDRLVPDQAEALRLKVEMEKSLVEAAAQASLAQADINKIEAAHPSIFVAGWRPAVCWVAVFTLAYVKFGYDWLSWALFLIAPELPALPAPDGADMYDLVLALLGLGGMRTIEKRWGVATDAVSAVLAPPPAKPKR